MKKSVNNILKNNQALLETKEVVELIDYIDNLQSNIDELNHKYKNYYKLMEYKNCVDDIYNSAVEIINDKNKEVDYKQTIKNLIKYIEDFRYENKY